MTTESIDFTVIPLDDLYLSKGSKSIKRVSKGDLYPCQMQKTQNFNCLFRHYAKHNGLDKETLIFTFLEELHGDQLPDMVHLLTGDEIFVGHRKEKVEEPALDTTTSLIRSLDAARVDSTFWDVKFVFVNESNAELGANKCIICSRSAYFCGMFRNSAMLESIQNRVEIFDHSKHTFDAMLEFLYTGNISLLKSFDLEQCTALLLLSNEYVIEDLKHLCQQAISGLITPTNISKLYVLADDITAILLKKNIKKYVEQNISFLKESDSFRREIQESPKLSLLLFDSIFESSEEGSVKRRRISTSPLIGNDVGYVGHADALGAVPVVGTNTTVGDIESGNGPNDPEATGSGHVVL